MGRCATFRHGLTTPPLSFLRNCGYPEIDDDLLDQASMNAPNFSPQQHKKSVLIIVENLPVPFDRRVWMEATTLKRAGYEVSLISPTGKGCERLQEEIEGIHIYRHRLPAERSSLLGYVREYASALWSEWRLALNIRKKIGFDIIHACNPPDLLFLVAVWFKVFHGTRFIFDHHDLSPELYESKFNKRGLFYHLLRLAERLTFVSADVVITPNESYKEIATSRGNKPPERVHVVRSGPDLTRFKRVAANATFRRGRKYLVGYLGVMAEFDGVDHLIRVAHELTVIRKRNDIQFCLIGSGPMLPDLMALAEQLEVSDYVEFAGRVPDSEVIERLSSCDVCVGPDPANPLNNKSTMNKILEYMALECPIVQYDLVEGKRSAGEASLYASPNNIPDFATKIEELLADTEGRSEMGRLGLQRMVERLEWKHQIPKLLKAYADTLGAPATLSEGVKG
jgi:glycosyltransferase involved in cell wall biosynthesis